MNKLQLFLDKTLEMRDDINVLEAGCGSASHFNFKQRTHLTGIDISERQLQRNIRLQKAILGDVQHFNFEPSSFDVIICWAVLEHLSQPELALRNFVRALKPDGIIVLELPNVLSLKGILTKYTPLSIHTWYYRHLFGRSNAGKDDVGPFKTYLRYSIAPNRINKFASQNGLKTVYFETLDLGDMPYWKRKNRAARIFMSAYKTLRDFFKFATFGKLGDSDFIIVLKKQEI